MKPSSTLFLKIVLGILAAGALFVISFALWLTYNAEGGGAPELRPIVFGMYVAAIPFLVALWQAMKLLVLIEKGTAFSNLAVDALKKIKYCGVAIGGIMLAGSPYLFHVADQDDAPGVIVIGFVIGFASIVVATFAALLQKLLKNVVDIKSENDMTV